MGKVARGPGQERAEENAPTARKKGSEYTYDFSSCFLPNFKSCIFRRAYQTVHSSTVVFVFSQMFNKIMLSLELEPQINCQQLPRTRLSDSRPPCARTNRQEVHFLSQLEAK